MTRRNSAVHGVLVTFRRPDELAQTLDRLSRQTRRLDTLIVVDNDADDTVRDLVSETSASVGTIEYLPSEENIGPAGALAIGVESILGYADDSDWIMFFDDDNPPRTSQGVAAITEFGEDMLQVEPRLGGVGLVGARFDPSTGRLISARDEELAGAVPVDYIGGGQLPCYRVTALREVGLPRSDLFFGFDDLEYGLRISEAGWRLLANGDAWSESRRASGRMGIDRSPSRTIGAVGWRTYYSTRNLIWILRQRGAHGAAARVIARTIAKGVYNLPRDPSAAWRYLKLAGRGILDALGGRLGRTFDPTSSA